MKIYVDISVMTDTCAVGRVYGAIEFSGVPTIGSLISFSSPINKIEFIHIDEFKHMLKVSDVIFSPMQTNDVSVAINLDDIVVRSIEDAKKVMTFFAKGFNLTEEEFDLNP